MRFGLAGLVMCLILVVLAVLWSAGPLLPRVGEAIAFGIALAAARGSRRARLRPRGGLVLLQEAPGPSAGGSPLLAERILRLLT